MRKYIEMKNSFITIAIALTFGMLGCKKEAANNCSSNAFLDQMQDAEVIFTIDSSVNYILINPANYFYHLQSQGSYALYRRPTAFSTLYPELVINTYDSVQYKSLSLIVDHISGCGTTNINPNHDFRAVYTTYFRFPADTGQIITDSLYALSETFQKGTITVTSLDTINHKVSGTFELDVYAACSCYIGGVLRNHQIRAGYFKNVPLSMQ
jgi:hypothetical protein